MFCRRRLPHPCFIFASLACGVIAALYVYVSRRSSGNLILRHQRDAVARSAETKAPCAWCQVVKSAGSHDRALELGEKPLAEASSGAWLQNLKKGLPRLAIILPYRNRASNLKAFLKYMHTFLGRQSRGKFTYWIFVMEQSKSGRFNRGKLCNAGFNLTASDFDYFIFHDVDKMPEIGANSYQYPNTSVLNSGRKCGAYHLASRVQQFNYRWMEDGFVGGALMFRREQYIRIGGMPNNYWGWGAEDDETYDRIKKRSKDAPDICRHKHEEKVQRYSSLDHDHASNNGDAIPNLSAEARRVYECHYEMMKDYRENRRSTDKYSDAVFKVMATIDDLGNRASVVTVDLCWGNFENRCSRSPKDVECNLNRRFG